MFSVCLSVHWGREYPILWFQVPSLLWSQVLCREGRYPSFWSQVLSQGKEQGVPQSGPIGQGYPLCPPFSTPQPPPPRQRTPRTRYTASCGHAGGLSCFNKWISLYAIFYVDEHIEQRIQCNATRNISDVFAGFFKTKEMSVLLTIFMQIYLPIVSSIEGINIFIFCVLESWGKVGEKLGNLLRGKKLQSWFYLYLITFHDTEPHKVFIWDCNREKCLLCDLVSRIILMSCTFSYCI